VIYAQKMVLLVYLEMVMVLLKETVQQTRFVTLSVVQKKGFVTLSPLFAVYAQKMVLAGHQEMELVTLKATAHMVRFAMQVDALKSVQST